jgi:hypothetical protein
MPASDAPSAAPVGLRLGAADVTEALLVTVVQSLERRPDLVARLRSLLGVITPAPTTPSSELMSIAEYARYRRVSERTVRYNLKQMVEGVHFHREGRAGRRVIIQVHEADRWRAEKVRKPNGALTNEDLAIDEVTRRRARVALNNRRKI